MALRRDSRQICEWIDRPAAVVYGFAADPAHLPEWALGLGSAVEQVGDRWFVETAEGRVGVAFAPPNELGVLDHVLTLPSGDWNAPVVLNLKSVIPKSGWPPAVR